VPQPRAATVAPLFDELDADELTQGDPLAATPLRAPKSRNDNNLILIAGIIAGVAAVLVLVLLIVVLWPSASSVTQTPQPAVATRSRDKPADWPVDVPPPRRTTAKPLLPPYVKEYKSFVRVYPGRASPKPLLPGEIRPGDEAPPRGETVSIDVSTNVHGATLVVRDAASRKQVHEVSLKGGQRSHRFDLQAGHPYEYEARAATAVVRRAVRHHGDSSQLVLNFDPQTVREICRMAVCLIRLPEGGHGSGFLFGDRQTVVTAAHVLMTRRVEDVELIFNPAEAKQTRLTGARLIYFDAKEDVAVLRLAKPVAVERPFLWHLKDSVSAESKFDARAEFLVIGNPARGDDYDPLYIRKAKIVSGRPDEFQLDIELHPGYSGGPVCLADTGQVAGLVSYKIIGGLQYQDVGKSFAKSADIADDAITNWTSMDANRQQDRVDRLAAQFTRQYGYRCAFIAGFCVFFDSAVYTDICVGVAADYEKYMAKELGQMNPGSRQASVRKKMREAHKKYITERAPEKAKEVRDEVSPKLREETKKWYDEAMADTTLPESIKEPLKKAHEQYVYLKDAAEQIVDPKAGVRGGKTVEEFLESVLKSWSKASEYSASAAEAARQYLE
jgi:S1-C subfamily serine protease